MNKRILAALLAGSMVLSLAACGTAATPVASSSATPSASASSAAASSAAASAVSPAASETAAPVKLRIYAQYSDDDTKVPYDYAVEQLKKDMPNVSLELDVQAQDDGQKLKTYAATGNLPDIFQANLDIINAFKESNNILVLDSYVDKLGVKANLQSGADNILYAPDGHVYAFPYAGNELNMLYVNKSVFEANGVTPPATFDELVAVSKALNGKGIVPLTLFGAEKWICVSLFDTIAVQYDAGGVKKLDQGKAKMSDPAYTEAAKKFEELIKAGLVAKDATALNYDQARSLYYEGKAAMFLNGQWEIADSTKNLGDKADWIPLPAVSADKIAESATRVSGSGGPSGYAVSPNTADKDTAAAVAAYLSQKYCDAKYLKRGTAILAMKPAEGLVPETPFPAMMDKLAKAIPGYTSYTAFDWGLGNATFKAGLEDACQRMLTGSYTADQFIADVDKVIAAN